MKTKLSVFLAVLALLPAFLAAAVPEGRPAPRVSMKLLRNGAVADFPGWPAYKGKVVVNGGIGVSEVVAVTPVPTLM